MPEITLQPYDPIYDQAFYDLNVRWLKEFFVVEDYDEKVLSNPMDYIISKGGEIWYAVMNDQAVGCAALMPAEAGVYEFTKYAVDPSAQGYGLGKLLMEHCIQRYKELGGHKLFLETNTKLETAMQLYKRYGWQEVQPEKPSPYARANCMMVWQDTSTIEQ